MAELTDNLIDLVDEMRRRGQSYDDVVAGLENSGVPAHETEPLLQEYRQVVDVHGRPREQVNLGDPHEQEWQA
jgi:phospholipid N-methyltransferase